MHIKRRHIRRILIAFAILLALTLIAARLYLPYWLRDHVNAQLGGMKTYVGNVEDIDVSLLRGAYTINNLRIDKRTKGMPVPFLTIGTTDLSIQWKALLQGRIVSDIHLSDATLNFAVNQSGTDIQTGEGGNWNETIKTLMPIDINLVSITRGKVTYRDFSSTPEVNIFIEGIRGEMRNLRNTNDLGATLPSTFEATGTSIGKGRMKLTGKMNVLTQYVDMDADLSLEGMDLTAINSYSSAYAAIDFESGQLDSYAELVIKEGAVSGYLKPIASNLKIIDQHDKDKNLLEMIWEPIAAALVEIFSNQSQDQFATRIPFEGRIDNVERPFWPQVTAILRNAFVEALSRRVEGEVSFDRKAD